MAALGTLVVGLGRSGAGLHVPALTLARSAQAANALFADQPFITVDPHGDRHDPLPGTVDAGSLAAAADLTDPAHTVVHLCTPPTIRVKALAELGRLGFRKIIIEKPLTSDERCLDEIGRLRWHWDLDLVVVAQWLASTLTGRIQQILRDGQHGSLRSIRIIQRKPRFTRSLADDGHPTAFDVEMPHSVGVALAIAGTASVRDAGWADMTFGDVTIPRLGTAWLSLDHAAGVRTEIRSDLTAPARERQITLELDGATLIGHYPSSGADEYAQLRIAANGSETGEIFRDDALTAFIVASYARFAVARPRHQRAEPDADLARSAEVVRLIGAAKRICARRCPGTPAALAVALASVACPATRRAEPKEAACLAATPGR